jgi:hypothetical protein
MAKGAFFVKEATHALSLLNALWLTISTAALASSLHQLFAVDADTPINVLPPLPTLSSPCKSD